MTHPMKLVMEARRALLEMFPSIVACQVVIGDQGPRLEVRFDPGSPDVVLPKEVNGIAITIR